MAEGIRTPWGRSSDAEQPTFSAFLDIRLQPEKVEPAGTAGQIQDVAPPSLSATAEQPSSPSHRVQKIIHDDEPTSLASLRISLSPTKMEAGGTVPATEAAIFIASFAMSITAIAGIMGAVATANIAVSHSASHAVAWFLSLAAAELGLALTVIVRIARRDRGGRERQHSTSEQRAVAGNDTP